MSSKMETIKLGLQDKIAIIFNTNKKLSKNKGSAAATKKIQHNRQAISMMNSILTSMDDFKNNLHITHPETKYSPEAFNEHFENFLSDTLHDSLQEAVEHEPALIVSDSLLNLKINPYRKTPKYSHSDKDWVQKGMSGMQAFFLGMLLGHKDVKTPFLIVMAALASMDDTGEDDFLVSMLIMKLLSSTEYKPTSNIAQLNSYLKNPEHIEHSNRLFQKACRDFTPTEPVVVNQKTIGWELPKPEFDRKTKNK